MNRSKTPSREAVFSNYTEAFTALVDNYVKEEDRIQFVYKNAPAIVEIASVQHRASIVKKMLMHFLKSFCCDPENLRDVEAVLRLWKLFGTCSRSMGTTEVLKKIEDSYVSCPLYYKIFAECLVENKEDEDLFFTFQKAIENCGMSEEEVRNDWGPEIMSHVRMPVEDDGTVCLFEQYRQCEARKSAAFRRRSSIAQPKLDFLMEEDSQQRHQSTHTTMVRTDSTQHTSPVDVIAPRPSLSIDSPPIVMSGRLSVRSGSPNRPSTRLSVRSGSPPVNIGRLSVRSGSPTRSASRPSSFEKDEVAITRVPTHQATASHAKKAPEPSKVEEFSIFCDPTINRTAASRTTDISKHQPANTTRVLAKANKHADSYDHQSTTKENIRRSFDPNSPTLCRQPKPVDMDFDDVTLRADSVRPTTTSTPENPTRLHL